MRPRLAYLDGWRGLAIGSLLIAHFFSPLDFMGSLAVELFFVLSGRLMATILFIEKEPLTRFFVRRFSRIYPGLIVFLIIVAAYVVLSGSLIAQPIHFLAASTFTTNYLMAGWNFDSALTHTWSLAVEEHSYILLAIVSIPLLRDPKYTVSTLATLALVGFAIGIVSTLMQGQYVYWRSDVRFASIFLSAAVAVQITRASLSEAFLRRMGLASFPLLLIGAALICFAPQPVAFTVGTICLAVAVNFIDWAPKAIKALFAMWPIVYFGNISYSLYLYQNPFAKHPTGSNILLAGILLVAAIACSIASYHLVEVPARRWINKRYSEPRPHKERPNAASANNAPT